ncbi:hypothetical protein HXA35_20635 [Bacillus sp. A301a_S52]|jgi:hypothetical protein|nr:hypothetical protein [Bacillus sp. A301a_S52]
MKKLLGALVLLLLITGCGEKVDDEVLEAISRSLEKRWEYTEDLSGNENITVEILENATQIELDELEEYHVDDFKDTVLYSRYTSYKSRLDRMKISLKNADIDSTTFHEEWANHMDERAKILYDINSKHQLNISEENKEIFQEVLDSASHLVKADEIRKSLSDNGKLSDIDVEIEENSISISFPTESVLSVNSFVSHKTGFPDKAMEILHEIKELDYDDIVITTNNQDAVAISSYFTKKSLENIDFKEWEDLDSVDAYKFYNMADAYHIRIGIWDELDTETQQLIGNMNKDNSDPFWKEHGYTH